MKSINNPQWMREYRRYRRLGYTAQQAKASADLDTYKLRHEFLDELSSGYCANGTIAGYEISVSIEEDPDALIGQDDVTGRFTDKHSDGCIPNTTTRSEKWYEPSTVTLSSLYDSLRKAGMSKAVARETYNEIVEREMTADAERLYWQIDIEASQDGQQVAHDSICGVDGWAMAIATADDMVGEMLHELVTERVTGVVANRDTVLWMIREVRDRSKYVPGSPEWMECSATQRALAAMISGGYRSDRYNEVFAWLTEHCTSNANPGIVFSDLVCAFEPATV